MFSKLLRSVNRVGYHQQVPSGAVVAGEAGPVMLWAMVERQTLVSNSLAGDKLVEDWVGIGQQQA